MWSLFRQPFCYKKVFFSSSIGMSGKAMNCGKKNIKKSKFYKNKKALKIYDINVNKKLVSKEESNGKKNQLSISLGIITMMKLELYE